MTLVTEDTRITGVRPVSTPNEVQLEVPLSDVASQTVARARREIEDVLAFRDDRLLVIVGPCSIHDPAAALEYAQRLGVVRQALEKDLLIVMRVYFEKPRTTVGWKGLINDPDLDDGFDINRGLRTARSLLARLNEQGMPAGVEFLDILTPQYLADLVSWGAIGARTTESQLHREMASGLSCPVGFKNGTDGGIRVAVDAVLSARNPHRFLSADRHGRLGIYETRGNPACHIILRGGTKGPNFDAASIAAACQELTKAQLLAQVMIDFSHANSAKQPARQASVVGPDVAGQIAGGDARITGVMIESHLIEGRQEIGPGMVYGQSVTDACLGWDDSVPLLERLARVVRERRQARGRAAA